MEAVNLVKRHIGIRRVSSKYVWFDEANGLLMPTFEYVVEYDDGQWGILYSPHRLFNEPELVLLDEAGAAAIHPQLRNDVLSCLVWNKDSGDERMEAAIRAHGSASTLTDERWWAWYRARQAALAEKRAAAEQERRAKQEATDRERQRDKELHRCEHCGGDIRRCSTQCPDECGELDCRYVWMAYGWRIKQGLLNVVPNEACDALAVMLREAEGNADG